MQVLFAMLWNYTPALSLNPAPSYVPGRTAIPAPPVTSGGRAYGHQPAEIANVGFELEATFGYDWYDRIHISSYDFALGNLIGEQLRSLTIWNAYRRARVLEHLQLSNAEGITVFGQPAPPLQFAPLQQRSYNLRVAQDGPALVDATITFDFDEGQAYAIRITGYRITAWPWLPDWEAGDGVTERLAWVTDVMTSKSTGRKQKRKLRQAPRRGFEFVVLASDQQRRVIESALYTWASRQWAFPIPTDGRIVPDSLPAGVSTIAVDTTGLDYRDGGQAMLRTNSAANEVIEILRVFPDRLELSRPTTRAWPRGVQLFPVRYARHQQWPTQTMFSDDASQLRVSFILAEPCDWPAASAPALYRGLPVLEWRPDESESPTSIMQRSTLVLDNQVGPVAVVDLSNRTSRNDGMSWMLEGRDQQASMRSWLYYFAGRCKEAWIPSWTADLLVVAGISASDVALVVEWSGYTRFVRRQPNRRDLRIELLDGSVFYRRITDATEIDDQTEQVVLDAAFDRAITPGQIRLISFMTVSELESDEVAWKHITDADGVATVRLDFNGVVNDI